MRKNRKEKQSKFDFPSVILGPNLASLGRTGNLALNLEPTISYSRWITPKSKTTLQGANRSKLLKGTQNSINKIGSRKKKRREGEMTDSFDDPRKSNPREIRRGNSKFCFRDRKSDQHERERERGVLGKS